jgi:hypothetical protein
MVDVPGGASGLLVRMPRQCRAPRRATAVDWRDLRMWNRAVPGPVYDKTVYLPQWR